jgi:hypothetical protein
LNEKLHQSEVALSDQQEKVEEALFRLEELLTFVKAECAEVERDNSILEENLKKKHKQFKSAKKKLSQVPKKKRTPLKWKQAN